jgi:hypothetical protein
VAVDTAGNLIVAEAFTARIRRVSSYNISCSSGEFFNGDFCTATPKGYFVPFSQPSILYGCSAGTV